MTTPTTGSMFKHWLLFIVCALIGSSILGMVGGCATGFCIGLAMGMNGGTEEQVKAAVTIPAFIVAALLAAPWSFFCYRWTVLKLFRSTQQGA